MPKRYNQRQIKNIERFKNAKFNYEKFVKKYYMEKGEAYITVKVNSLDDIISKYSIKDYEWINPDFADYIEECANYIPMEVGIVIEICGPDFTEEEQVLISNVIKNYFGLELQDKEIDIIINNRIAKYLLLWSAISLIIVIVLQNFNLGEVISELLFLAMWFFIWEYGDYGLLKKSELKLEKLYAGQLLKAKISFIDKVEESESQKPLKKL